MNKKEMLVAAIEDGTVIDHIPADKTFLVANLLGLLELNTPVTIGNNYDSERIGKKGIIKVENKFKEVAQKENDKLDEKLKAEEEKMMEAEALLASLGIKL